MKGIILAGGSGTRLYPITSVTSKQLLPVYDKPMIYYPLSILMMAGLRDILIISSPHDLPRFSDLLGSGAHLGLKLSYCEQPEPNGIAEAFILAEDYLEGDPSALILGDNIFYGPHLEPILQNAAQLSSGGLVFGYQVQDPARYGVIDFDSSFQVKDIIEKPAHPPSNYAVTGLYFYDKEAPQMAKSLKPSWRGELEITDLNRLYLEKGALSVELLERGYAWLDTGTHDALHKASSFVQTIQERQGIKIACIEEIAYQKGYIDVDQLSVLAAAHASSSYGEYLTQLNCAPV